MISTWANVLERHDLLRRLVSRDLKEYSAGTRLGWLWWLLDPLLLMMVYWAVMTGILGRGAEGNVPYPIFLFPALLIWKHFSDSASVSMGLLRSRESIIKAIPFPTAILPFSLVLAGLINFLVGCGILFGAVLLLAGAQHTGDWLALVQFPLLMFLQLVIIVGICLPLTVVGALIPDLGKIVSHLLVIGFWLSPSLYSSKMAHDALVGKLGSDYGELFFKLFMLNPFATLMDAFRECVLHGRYIPLQDWLVLFGEGAVFLLVGGWIYRLLESRVIKAL